MHSWFKPFLTDNTRDLLEVTEAIFQQIYREGFRYAKAGVILSGFYEYGTFQEDLFRPSSSNAHFRISHSGLGAYSLLHKMFHQPGQ
ncbi:hypothetical protein [Marinomonas algarum]|uniref:DinB/UmuC family translesion DNA polymerase n=1 Tax=Marinomonas algarum TaxID=2883105 RepID=UPI0030B82140